LDKTRSDREEYSGCTKHWDGKGWSFGGLESFAQNVPAIFPASAFSGAA
jgi:hypothetical protein